MNLKPRILALLKQQPRTLREIAASLYASVRTVATALSWLKSRGAVTRSYNHRWCKCGHWQFERRGNETPYRNNGLRRA